MKPRIVIHYDEAGEMSVHADAGIDVFYVDENVPRDRIYRANPEPIPDDMLTGPIGHRADGSPAAYAAHIAAEEIEEQEQGAVKPKKPPKPRPH